MESKSESGVKDRWILSLPDDVLSVPVGWKCKSPVKFGVGNLSTKVDLVKLARKGFVLPILFSISFSKCSLIKHRPFATKSTQQIVISQLFF